MAEATATGQTILVAHPSPDLYGSDRVLLESVRGLIGAGHRVVVTLPSSGALVPALVEQGAEVEICVSPVLRKSALGLTGMLRLILQAVISLVHSARLVRATSASAVFVNTVTIPVWLIVGRLTRRRVICHVHEAEQSASPLIRRVLYAPLLLAHRIIVNSRFTLDVCAESWPSLQSRSEIIYNGVPGPARIGPLRAELDVVQLLFLGRLSPRKGPDVALRALRMLKERGMDAHLSLLGAVFAGYEWFEQELRNYVEENGLGAAVTFLGFDPDVWGHLDACDIVLVPSIVDESFGNTAVEAILAERPLVVSATSGLKEAADGYVNARQVDPGSEAAICEAVTDLVSVWPSVRDQAARDRTLADSRHSLEVYHASIAEFVDAATRGSARRVG